MAKSRVCVLEVVCLCAPLFAQSNLATLSGSIQDPQKSPVVDATLQLKSVTTGEIRTAVLNSGGLFEVAGLKPGEYELEIRAQGFETVNRTVQLEIGQEMRLDLTLSVGEKREFVEIVARAEVLKTSD